ncbi:nuclear transport factor 2 family protein [Plantactinospora sp. S1510]|uniref:Nuclear transport factor 2 family protein n=1 Tax=Plantactinospora alkalitolerans TaxID=2789879 RepID=A0ABS0GQF1_9ACTN|nr:nuclear transport factor 2 family protein [Plantactinospora alkalitolerans]MBF9128127.1 nuclear transport factor 2 family protein [Plantactinospora alkalitolerans]
MTDQNSPALRVALAYHQAWTGRNLDEAMAYVADDVVCDAPAGRIEGADAYRALMEPFVQMLISAETVAAFGDEEQAIVVYDTTTTLVSSGPAAECVTVRDGRIAYSRFIFDRLPFQLARSTAS